MPDFIIIMNAFRTKPSIVKGVKVELGDRLGGFSTIGRVKSTNGAWCTSEEEIRDVANHEWTTTYLGAFKEMIIKMDKKIIAHHSNYEVDKYGNKSFKKKG